MGNYDALHVFFHMREREAREGAGAYSPGWDNTYLAAACNKCRSKASIGFNQFGFLITNVGRGKCRYRGRRVEPLKSAHAK